jgi:hypothetical protein
MASSSSSAGPCCSPRHSSWLADLRAMTAVERPLHGWSFFLPGGMRDREAVQDRLDILGADEAGSAVPKTTAKGADGAKTRGWVLAWPDELEALLGLAGSEIVLSTEFLTDVERLGRALPVKWYTCAHVCGKRRKAAATKQQSRRKRPAAGAGAGRAAVGAGGNKKQRRRLAYSADDDRTLAAFVRGHGTKSPGGNVLWKLAEEEALLSGRTWQSMRDRYLKHVRSAGDSSSSSSSSSSSAGALSAEENHKEMHLADAFRNQPRASPPPSPAEILRKRLEAEKGGENGRALQALENPVSSPRRNDAVDEGQTRPPPSRSAQNEPQPGDEHLTAATLLFGSLQTTARDGDVGKFLALPAAVRTNTLTRWAAKHKDPLWSSDVLSLAQFESQPWSVYDDLALLRKGTDGFCRKRHYDLFEEQNVKVRHAFLNAMQVHTPAQYRELTRSLRKAFRR